MNDFLKVLDSVSFCICSWMFLSSLLLVVNDQTFVSVNR